MGVRRRSVLALAAAWLLVVPCGARADEVLVSAASSLTDALQDVGKAYSAAHVGTTIRFNFAASGVLQKQIENGAPVDVFASASPKEMDALQKAGKIDAATRFDFAGNRLVLIVAAGSGIKTWADLTGPTIQHVAISEPATVPSGRYAQETLTHRGLWTALDPKLVRGSNVRQTLAYVADGNAEAGLVFASDALVEKRVRVIATATPGVDHTPIVYPIAVVKGAPNPACAKGFAAYLKTDAARKILAKYGFTGTL